MVNQLVSVVLVTYNSSKFIEEALDSIKEQTWIPIELIITDDCSSDNTVTICQKWLSYNRNRFVKAQIIQCSQNTGVSANGNRGLRQANGEWIIFPAGDDVLLPNCIRDNVAFVLNYPDVRVLFSKVKIYRDTFDANNYVSTIPDEVGGSSVVAPERTAEEQYQMLLRSDSIHFTPSVFLHRETMLSVGGFDERFRLLEDYPLWLNLTKNGYKLHFMDKVTVGYRTHASAINNTGKKFLVNPNYFEHEEFRRIYTYPFLPRAECLNQQYTWFVSQLYRSPHLNKVTGINRIIYWMLVLYINPFRYYLKLKKMLS